MYEEIYESIKIKKERQNELVKQLRELDLIGVDIAHLVENTKNASASTGYKIFKEYQINLEKRRIVKDELEEIRNVLPHLYNIKVQLDQMSQKINNKENKVVKYNIRTKSGKELFKNHCKLQIKSGGVVVCSQGK